MDSTGLDILFKLVRLGQRKQVCLQWIPSHVGVPGNEAADELAGRGCDLPNLSSTVLTYLKIPSLQRNQMNLTWKEKKLHRACLQNIKNNENFQFKLSTSIVILCHQVMRATPERGLHYPSFHNARTVNHSRLNVHQSLYAKALSHEFQPSWLKLMTEQQ
ncbi:RNase H domain-containing protein [Trichonephila clavipes]|nr:RNase H domain-containing protein [Trichonephila clavipes]